MTANTSRVLMAAVSANRCSVLARFRFLLLNGALP